jgi:hypothetical protein
MRRLIGKFDRWRQRGHAVKMWGWEGDETCGAFVIPFTFETQRKMPVGKVLFVQRSELLVVASTGEGWDHVSVSLEDRCPTWEEMEFIKKLFFRDDETAMQLHVPETDHVNVHPNCLHLWRPNDGREIPRPPSIMVG